MSGLVRADLVAQVAEAARVANPISRIQHAMARLHIPAHAAPPDPTATATGVATRHTSSSSCTLMVGVLPIGAATLTGSRRPVPGNAIVIAPGPR